MQINGLLHQSKNEGTMIDATQYSATHVFLAAAVAVVNTAFVSLPDFSCDPICRSSHIALSDFCLSSILFYDHLVQSASYNVLCRVNKFNVTQRPSKATCTGLSCAGSRLRQRAEPVKESLNAYLELMITSCAGLGEASLAIASNTASA